MRIKNNADENKQTASKLNRGGFRLKKRLPKLSLLLIALVITFSSVVSLITPQLASAVNTVDGKDADWQIKSLIYYRALGNCIKYSEFTGNFWNGEFEMGSVNNGNWFEQSLINVPGVGPYLRGIVEDNNDHDIRAYCNNANDIVNPAMTLWGFANNKEDFICDIGGKHVNGAEGDSCKTAAGGIGNFNTDGITIEKYREFVQKTVYGKLGEPQLKDGFWYAFYLRVFENSCAYGKSPLTDESEIEQLNVTSDSSAGYKVDIAQADGTVKETYYRGALERKQDVATRPAGIEGNFGYAPTVNYPCGSSDPSKTTIEERLTHYSKAGAFLLRSGELTIVPAGTPPSELEGGTTCNVDGIGWLLCPLSTAVAGLTDSLYAAVSAFLRVSPAGLSTANNPLYTAWSTMRTIANVAFVIVFLIIIFSQLSSVGISNYGVKKMLPRLVVAAILVNISFYICSIAIDISNILGTSLQDVFKFIATQASTSVVNVGDSWSSIASTVLVGSGVVGGISLAVFSSAGPWAALAGLLPLLFGALFALVIAFVVLIARQALIIMLVVVAPLAFVAYLLPNTESLFKKWRGLFISMLALFPMMSIVFGGSQLASVILRNSSTSLANGDSSAQITSFFLYLGSFAVQAIPLFITPVLIKLSGGILGRFAGLINNPNKGPFDRARKWAEQRAENARTRGYTRKLRGEGVGGKGIFATGARMKARREAVDKSLKTEQAHAETGYVADRVNSETKAGSRLRRRMAGSGNEASMQRIQAGALRDQQKQKAEDAAAGEAIMEEMNLSGAQRQELALTGRTTRMVTNPRTGVEEAQVYTASKALQRAAIERQMTTGSWIEKKEIVDGSVVGGSVNEFAQVIASKAASSPGLSTTDPALAGRRIDDMTQGRFTYDEAVVQAFNEGKYTSDAIVTMHNDARQELLRIALEQSAAGNPQMLASLQKAVEGVENSPEIAGKAAGNAAAQADMKAIKEGSASVAQLVQSRQGRKQDAAYESYVTGEDGVSNVPEELQIRQDAAVAREEAAFQTYVDAGNVEAPADPVVVTPTPADYLGSAARSSNVPPAPPERERIPAEPTSPPDPAPAPPPAPIDYFGSSSPATPASAPDPDDYHDGMRR